jgi:hypothetical protein
MMPRQIRCTFLYIVIITISLCTSVSIITIDDQQRINLNGNSVLINDDFFLFFFLFIFLSQRILPQLVNAATYALIFRAMESHVREAARRNWTLPMLSYDAGAAAAVWRGGGGAAAVAAVDGGEWVSGFDGRSEAGAAEGPAGVGGEGGVGGSGRVGEGSSMRNAIRVDGMWPYWLDARSTSTVRNSFEMDGMFLLTGPNMAGKSTVLRSTCALCLLASCGLHVPAGKWGRACIHGSLKWSSKSCHICLPNTLPPPVPPCSLCRCALHRRLHAAQLLGRFPYRGALQLCGRNDRDEV